MNKLLISYIIVMALVGMAALKFLMTSVSAVDYYKELCYAKYGKDHIKCAFVGDNNGR